MRIVYFCSPLRAAGHLQPRPLRASPTAKTASDHEAIANYYKQQAAGSRAKVDRHKKMARQYSMSGIGNQATKTHFHQHCEALIRSYEAEAAPCDWA